VSAKNARGSTKCLNWDFRSIRTKVHKYRKVCSSEDLGVYIYILFEESLRLAMLTRHFIRLVWQESRMSRWKVARKIEIWPKVNRLFYRKAWDMRFLLDMTMFRFLFVGFCGDIYHQTPEGPLNLMFYQLRTFKCPIVWMPINIIKRDMPDAPFLVNPVSAGDWAPRSATTWPSLMRFLGDHRDHHDHPMAG